MLQKSTIQLLRFHFSFFLLPVYLFALSHLPEIDWTKAALVFVVLHLLVYPSSNGFNSYMDRDETPIGALKNPMQPTRELWYVTLVMDGLAFIISFFIAPFFALGILVYILISRAYSARSIRLKKHPVVGFLTVFFFQGCWVFWLVYYAVNPYLLFTLPVWPAVIASLLIGSLYPLTQVYQHEADLRDGVKTISYILGVRGTFLFSMLLFILAAFLFYKKLYAHELNLFYLYLLVTLPVVLFFVYWMLQAWQDKAKADFKNSLYMNVIATVCTSVYFFIVILLRH